MQAAQPPALPQCSAPELHVQCGNLCTAVLSVFQKLVKRTNQQYLCQNMYAPSSSMADMQAMRASAERTDGPLLEASKHRSPVVQLDGSALSLSVAAPIGTAFCFFYGAANRQQEG